MSSLGASLPSVPQSLAPTATDLTGNGDLGTDISRRLMRVKVLYTFDDQNKSNCLVRLPNTLNIATVSLDENTQVGIVDLKTCVQAIVAASPELVAKLGHDYTVYAYDFSEYDTPLVGQGMLSWILASASQSSNVPLPQSNTMVTGRVCKNILGLFSNGVKETLEVRLKLIPVPTCLQSEYIESMEKYRSLSQIIPGQFDPAAWNDFLKANPAIVGHGSENSTPGPVARRESVGGIESFHQYLTQKTSTDKDNEFFRPSGEHHYAMSVGAYSTHGSRAGSPTPSFRSCSALPQTSYDNGSRPVSRDDNKEPSRTRSRGASFDGDSAQHQHQHEGPPRKRARVTKAERPGKLNIKTYGESLRVTASTAASIRSHRPFRSGSCGPVSNGSEQPPRAPTPRPDEMSLRQQRLRNHSITASSLRHHSTSRRNSGYVSPYPSAGPYSDVAADSADDEQGCSAGETPMEFPSSPPLLPLPDDSPAMSSPVLPSLPYPGDSGFVSDSAADREDDADASKDTARNTAPSAAPRKKRAGSQVHQPSHVWQHVCPGPAELLPKRMLLDAPKIHSRALKSDNTVQPLHHHQPSPPSHVGTPESSVVNALSNQPQTTPAPAIAREVQHPLPQLQGASHPEPLPRPSSDHARPSNSMPLPSKLSDQPSINNAPSEPRRRQYESANDPAKFTRSQTWCGELHPGATPDADSWKALGAVPGFDREGTSMKQPRSGSGARRSRVIQENLERSLMAGEMPPYCHNCGEIKTPTWRKAWTRLQISAPETSDLSEGRINGFDIVRIEGQEPQYRIYKKSIAEEERRAKTFEPLQLCNPCGLWFEKKGNMRPPDRWEKQAGKRKRGRPAGKKQKSIQDQSVDCSSDLPCTARSDAIAPDASSTEQIDPDRNSKPLAGSEAMQPRDRPISSLNNRDSTARAALRRAVQSSPARSLGTRESPVEVEADLTPKPTKRLLFPSPRKEGEVKYLGELPGLTSLNSQRATSAKEDKENCPPLDEHDEFADLFAGENNIGIHRTPKSIKTLEDIRTPTSKSRRTGQTPRRNGSDEAAETPSRTRSSQAHAPLTPFTAQLTQLFSDANNGSPSRLFDFSSFPTFSSPGKFSRETLFSDDFLSTDLPMTSSPPTNMFSLYEDPATSTPGLWDATAIFEGGNSAQDASTKDATTPDEAEERTSVAVDFTAIIEEVVGSRRNTEVEAEIPAA